jgi:hypothetical protein
MIAMCISMSSVFRMEKRRRALAYRLYNADNIKQTPKVTGRLETMIPSIINDPQCTQTGCRQAKRPGRQSRPTLQVAPVELL